MRNKLSEHCVDFIDDAKLEDLVNNTKEDKSIIREVIAKSMEKKALSVKETAVLLSAESPDIVDEIFNAARQLKKDVYGNRIVIFAPLYIGNYCINDCAYCAFRKSLRTTVRKTLSQEELIAQIEALEDNGHKRLILVFGEHPDYTPGFIADTVRKVYTIRKGHGEIRRVNINAAPMDHDGFRKVKAAGIGTYQIFQETYHHSTYAKMHPAHTCKGDYLWRLDGLSRAFESGCDDMGLGALFGLYGWKFEVLGLVTHSHHLQKTYGVGPHTISFPRIRPAHGVELDKKYFVSDYDFKRLVAILRLSVPYTGMILTARETAGIRREVMAFGVSQIDAGTKLELAGYTKKSSVQELSKEQFQIGDVRPMDEILRELLQNGYIPSFCTSCYRSGRTGQIFMEYAIPGFIEKFCTPNALLTLEEYLIDYASPETRQVGEELIVGELQKISCGPQKQKLLERLNNIKNSGQRDLYF
ncbi:MAG TPA: [FeFe] hydrogenase H-cluster radical SAM maturase HydG [Lentisphaeria bacterium]|nr:MAG: [FeFe] hydrogenase H-cluster radical SAM maturase HydG [Lentisphaerae bacterium GWF2_49_21]HBC89271.1 [FeFe] hydrogenase H-cluster radical SAM maturase HydG [Lentisphaeria bacterium]